MRNKKRNSNGKKLEGGRTRDILGGESKKSLMINGG